MVNNVTGWAELMNGSMIKASFIMYDTALLGWFVAVLFIVYQFMILIKTRNLSLAFVTGIIFASMYVSSTLIKQSSVQIMVALLVFELAGIIYFLIWD